MSDDLTLFLFVILPLRGRGRERVLKRDGEKTIPFPQGTWSLSDETYQHYDYTIFGGYPRRLGRWW